MKKILILLTIITLFAKPNCVFAFEFPTPDWGALLNEKTEMVNNDSMELYIEGSNSSAVYYGAKLEPKSGVYFGIVAENSDIVTKPISSYLTYFEQSIGQTDIYYPANTFIKSDNVVATIGWTVEDINNIDYEVIRQGLENLNTYNKPMFIRFANEMNVSSIGDDPEIYKQVFRNVANMVHEYDNFATVWSPNDLGGLDRPFEYFYPGDEYVDWVGISSYMKKYFMGDSSTSEESKIYFMIDEYAWTTNCVKPIIKFMQNYNIQKPIMISEGGVSYYNKLGEDNTAWAMPRLRNMYWNLIMEYPQIKLINYFNVHREYEFEYFDVTNNTQMIEIMNEALSNGAFIREYGQNPDFTFSKANDGQTLKAKDGIVNLYTSAHFTKHDVFPVTYKLDGNWYHSSNNIPFICKLDISNLTDGEHTIEISAIDKIQNYTFYKQGNYIRFNGIPEVPKDIIVNLNGVAIAFDQSPIIEEGRTLVPMRAIFEALGATVSWDENTKTVKGYKDGTTIEIQIGNNILNKNGERIILDVPAKIVGARTLVPVRAISESLGCKVEWDGENRIVSLN